MNYIDEINKLRKEKNAVILAHYYQVSEIQNIADFVGDSLGLAQNALKTNADIIVFAGVNFMAETAKILNPNKKVLLPDLEAGCSLAESCPANKFESFIKNYSDHKVITYINSSIEVKLLTDVVCTSSNAVQIVESFPKEQKLIFGPDKNLGAYVQQITGRELVLWPGQCHVHDTLNAEAVVKLKINNPTAKLLAHPECQAVILEMADFIGSTTAILNFAKNDSAQKYIVATETGILHPLQKDNPQKEFIIVNADETCACNDCEYMKRITLEKIYLSLLHETHEITLSAEVIEKAKKPILRMLELS